MRKFVNLLGCGVQNELQPGFMSQNLQAIIDYNLCIFIMYVIIPKLNLK